MDMNLTIAIPVTGFLLFGNLVVNILRYAHIKKNGVEASMLIDIKEGQEKCHECFNDLRVSGAQSEVHLANIVSQLQTLNNNWRQK